MGLERRTRAAASEASAPTTTPLPPSRQASSDSSSSSSSSTTTTTASATSSSALPGPASALGSSSSSSNQKTVAILLLAHDGVANPGLWERWRRSSGPAYGARVRFFVFRNERLAFPSAFADAYDLGLRLPTQWCAASTTHASLQAVQRVLEADPQCAQVFLVSGRDVPVFPPRVLFHPRRVTTEGTRYRLRPFASIVCQAEPHWQDELKDEDLWEEAAAGRNPFEALIREHVVCHNTFLALSRSHARLLLRFPRECPQAYRRLLRLGDHRRFIPLTCPEEWLLGTMLRLLLNGPTNNNVGALLQHVRALTGEKATATTPAAKTKTNDVAMATAMTTPAAPTRRALSVNGSAGSTGSAGSSSSGGGGWTDGEAEAEASGFSSSSSDNEEEEEDEEEVAVTMTRRQTRSRSSTDSSEAQAANGYAREVVNWPLTDQNREEADDPSPLTWASWDSDPHVVLYAPGDKRRWTLRDALRSAQANGHLFYRKVGPLSRREVEVLCAELYGLVEEEEEDEEESDNEWDDGVVGCRSPSSLPIEAALLARAAKRARRNHHGGGSGSGFLSPSPTPGIGIGGGGIAGGRRYTLRVPTRHCMADGSGGLYCGLLPKQKQPKDEGKGGNGDDDMAIRRGRLETLAKGRR